MNPKYKPLFLPFEFPNGIKVKNRLLMAPMTNWSSHPDGTVSDSELSYYACRAKGVGMAITACAYVTPNGKGFSGQIAVDRDDVIPGLRRLASVLKEQGAKAILQIYHGGSKCPHDLVPNGEIVSASDVLLEEKGAGESLVQLKMYEKGRQGPPPRALKSDEVEEIVRAFGKATRRAIEAGFDGVEVHGASGYLPQQFYSPYTNRRNDAWGGTLQKRMRFHLSVVDEVKRVAAASKQPFLVGYRITPEEPATPGITMKETCELVDALAKKKLDYIHISQKNFWSKPRRGAELSRLRIEVILERVGHLIPVIGVGSIITPDDALRAMETGVQLLAIGHQLIIDPDWVQKVEKGEEGNIRREISPNEQAQLKIPAPLWQMIMTTPGWFPIKNSIG